MAVYVVVGLAVCASKAQHSLASLSMSSWHAAQPPCRAACQNDGLVQAIGMAVLDKPEEPTEQQFPDTQHTELAVTMLTAFFRLAGVQACHILALCS